MKCIAIYAAGWVGLVILAILNGVIRAKAYAPFMNELSAHQVSTAIGLCCFGIYIWIFYRYCQDRIIEAGLDHRSYVALHDHYL